MVILAIAAADGFCFEVLKLMLDVSLSLPTQAESDG